MKKTLLGLSAASFIVVIAAACGGGNTNENTNTTPNPSASTASSGATTASATPAEDAGPPKANIEAQRDPFVQACMRKMPATAYCNCAFDQFKDVFKDADLTSKPSEAQMESLKQKTVGNCATKLTEPEVKGSFGSACVGDNPKKQGWCDCEWTTLRGKLQLADFVSDFEGPKYDDAKKAVATTCKGKLDEPTAKGEFMSGCNKGAGTDHQKACDCMWKKLRSKSSVEEIAVGAVDLKKAGLEACKTQ